MRSLGQFFLIFGVLSAVLKLLNLGIAFLLLIWVDNWGPEVGWAIRIGMVLIGGALIGWSMKKDRSARDSLQPPPPGRI